MRLLSLLIREVYAHLAGRIFRRRTYRNNLPEPAPLCGVQDITLIMHDPLMLQVLITPTPFSFALGDLNAIPQSARLTPQCARLTPHRVTLMPHRARLTPHSVTLMPHRATLTPQSVTLMPHRATLTPQSVTLFLISATLFTIVRHIHSKVRHQNTYVLHLKR